MLDFHVQWLAKIRERVWEQCNDDEKDYLPSVESLKFHWLRANWVSCLWLQADQANVEYSSIDNYGWTTENGDLRFRWDTPENIAHITNVVKQLTSGRSCKKGCKTKRCKCNQGHRDCNVSCKSKSCENPHQIGQCADPICATSASQIPNEIIEVLNTERTVMSSTESITGALPFDTSEESDDSENESDKESEPECNGEDQYDFDHLNQSERKPMNMESENEDNSEDGEEDSYL